MEPIPQNVTTTGERRATGKTTRAILKAALQLSEGKHLALVGSSHEHNHFLDRLLDLCSMLGFIESYQRERGRLTTKGGGKLIRYRSRDSLRALRDFIEVEEI